MKIELKTGERNYRSIHKLNINDKHFVTITDLSENPEDAIIGRSLIDGYGLLDFIEMGYNAGKNGEELEIDYADLDN